MSSKYLSPSLVCIVQYFATNLKLFFCCQRFSYWFDTFRPYLVGGRYVIPGKHIQ